MSLITEKDFEALYSKALNDQKNYVLERAVQEQDSHLHSVTMAYIHGFADGMEYLKKYMNNRFNAQKHINYKREAHSLPEDDLLMELPE